jgi:hypothetical protein
MGMRTMWQGARSYAPLAILVITTVGAAGVSTATAPTQTAPRQWTSHAWQATRPVSDPNEDAATNDAQGLLGLVHVAPGWAPAASAPTPWLTQPVSDPATPNLVDRYQLWTTPGTVEAVQAWVGAHPPTGSRPAGSATGSQNGTLVETGLTFGYSPTAGHFESRQLIVATSPLPRGGSGIRVDAQVVWFPSRPAAEMVPGAVTGVTATVFRRGSPGAGSSETVIATATFTDHRVVTFLAGIVDSLPTAVPGARSCPADTGTNPQLELAFSGPPGVPEVVVHLDTNGCRSVSFSLRGTEEAPLSDNGLFHRVDQLLGLDLATIDNTR